MSLDGFTREVLEYVAIRNPKPYKSVEQRHPIPAVKYLALASLLIERADEGTKHHGD